MDVLPRGADGAAANMARDLLLLEDYPRPGAARFRCYGWTEPAHTLGISQRWAEWRPRVPSGSALIRRPTGGGLVSHLGDWTFAAAIPAGHPVSGIEAIASYAVVLGALRAALAAQGLEVAAAPLPAGPRPFRPPADCGSRAEPHDLVAPGGRKAAGAAQKRTRAGLLLQGYVDRAALPGCDWESLGRAFPESLAAALGERAEAREWTPDPAALSAATARFASAEWNERT